MVNKSNYNFNQIGQDFDSFYQILKGEVLPLANEYYDKARKRCQQHPKPQKWRIYLYVLALEALKQWLTKKGLTVDDKECKILQPWYLNLVDTGCILQVGDLKICLIVNEDLSDEQVIIPKALIEKPEQNPAHFYVLIEMWESEQNASIRGFFSHLQLLKISEKAGKFIQDEKCEDYEIPLQYFSLDSDKLLRYLESPNLVPAPLSNAVAQTQSNSLNLQQKSQEIIERIKASISDLLSQEVSLKEQLAQVLNWEDKLFLINHPQVIKYLQNVINLASWLKEVIDNMADSDNFGPLSSLIPSSNNYQASLTPSVLHLCGEVQSTGNEILENYPIIKLQHQMQNKGFFIPSEAQCCPLKFKLNHIPLELLVGTWLQEEDQNEQWSFLLILRRGDDHGGKPRYLLPGVQLKVMDKNKTSISNHQIPKGKQKKYIKDHQVGKFDDEFSVTITFKGEKKELGPFPFVPLSS